MITEYFLLIIYLMLLFAVWNITAIRYKQRPTKGRNRAFHMVGLFLKLPPIILMFPNVKQMLIYAIIVWPIYDLIISLGIAKIPFLIGTTSKIDKTLGKVKFYLQALLIIYTILYFLTNKILILCQL